MSQPKRLGPVKNALLKFLGRGVQMKRFVLGSVVLAAMIAGPAMAAELPVKAPPPAPTYYDWTGVYLGASIGWVGTHVERSFPAIPPVLGGPATFSSSGNDTIYDIHAGAQVQWG